jgi:hypothetical protein
MFHCQSQFVREAAMGDEHKTDHDVISGLLSLNAVGAAIPGMGRRAGRRLRRIARMRQLSMGFAHAPARFHQPRRQPLNDVNGPVPPTGAPDRDSRILFAFLHEAGQEQFDKLR